MKNILSTQQMEQINKFVPSGIKNLLKQYPQIAAGYIFGSRLKGNNLDKSDLDIALVCFNKQGLSQIELGIKFDKIIKAYSSDVSVVDLTNDPVFLIEIINGQVIFQKSQKERINLETRILQIYEDTRHFRNIKKYYLEKSFKEGLYAY